jgi:hypothetical protein
MRTVDVVFVNGHVHLAPSVEQRPVLHGQKQKENKVSHCMVVLGVNINANDASKKMVLLVVLLFAFGTKTSWLYHEFGS